MNGKSSAPMATSESSGGLTRAATSAEEEDDEAKNIDKVENYKFRSFFPHFIVSFLLFRKSLNFQCVLVSGQVLFQFYKFSLSFKQIFE